MGRISTKTLLVGTSIMVALAASGALAQVAPSADAGKVEKRFELPPVPRSTNAPVIETPAEPQAVSGQDSVSFMLSGVQIDGETAYTQAELQTLFSGLIGQQVTLGQVQEAVNAITRKYRSDGYVLSRAVLPAQDVTSGTVRVRVLEGYVAKVSVEGDVSRCPKIETYLKKIENIRPLKVQTLERYILLANDLPGVSAKAVIRPAQDAVGGAEVVVTVLEKKYEGSFGVDNRGTKFLGPVQFTTILTGNNLAGIYDRTTVRNITTAQTDELRFFDITHEEQLGSEGTKLRLTAARADTRPGSTLEPLEIKGDSTTFGLGVYHPFIRTRAENLTLRALADYRTTSTDVLNTELSQDRIRSIRVGGEYDKADPWNGINLVDAQVSHGVNLFNPTDRGIGRSRADGKFDYTKIEATASRKQSLPLNLSWLAQATGQYAFDPLLSPEEFSLGGIGFGQAYDPSELTGDHGAAFHTELQYGNVLGYSYFDSYQVYTYYDIGSVWQKQSALTRSNRQSLASTGLGVRFNVNQHVSGSTELALPLTKDYGSNGDRNARIYFGLIGRF